ncbi:MAG TPA: Tol-Pal system beta propeller repeat protein TolB [Candidatus Polarisedimenticolia bacterium]|nr:Tol-Pal system beta propeller repeat protein TolB [Candidatus Polarisedimenticolia bacterium]
MRGVATARLLGALALGTVTLGRPGAAGLQEPPAAAGTPASPAAPSEPIIRIVGTARPRIPIAIPEFPPPGGDAHLTEIARTIHDVLRDDLDFSGYFALVPEEYYKLVHDAGDRRVAYKEWLGVGAESLLLGKVSLEPPIVVFEGKLYDTTSQKMTLGKRYRGEEDLTRLLAHRLSDEIVSQSNQQGIAQSRIAYVSQIGKAKEIFIMDYDGARAKRITANGTINLSPAWSPDGREIAFVSYRGGGPELMLMNSAGELRRAFPQGEELNSAPAWSPDGRLLAFSSSRDGNAEIYTLRVADGTLTRLTRNDAIDTSPSWAPSGREIAFTSDRTGTPQIYLMDAEGANVRRLTFDVSYCDAASWSPLGDRIAFTARQPGGFDIYVKNLGTGELRQLTRDTNINEWPRWSPDGRHLVFASNRSGNFDVYTMDADGIADGARVHRLTHGGNSYSPSWSR